MSSSSCSLNTRSKQTSDIVELFETSPSASRLMTPSVKIPNNFRLITPTIPSFLQNVNVINITINYSKGSDEQQE